MSSADGQIDMKTNRDLYKSIEGLLKEKSGGPVPSLEDYLSNLLNLARRLADRSTLSLEEFFSFLRDAFDVVAAPAVPRAENAVPAFVKWYAQVAEQIRDLREMAQQGQLRNDLRYFGLSAPSGRRWYNFDPCTYIECGVVGSLAAGRKATTREDHTFPDRSPASGQMEISLHAIPANWSKRLWRSRA